MVYPVGQDGKVDYSRLVPCSCIREEIEKKRAAALLRFCELPAGTDHMTFANFKVRLGLREAYLYALGLARGGEPTWLTLMAGTGRGKTHLAIAIVRCWLARGIPAKYVHVPLLFEDLRRGFRESGDMSYEARFDRIMKVPLLLMDDLGTENSTPWVQEKLEIIFDYRLMNNLALVVTTNTPFDELPFRIASRLERLPGARVVNIEVEEYGVSDAIS
jgi:DNA replication protein DnaC